uniref:Uncharacterized protein n=1 Tax=Panagrolaimus sp. ES5 TaxID=591445 RepID=A0AC34FLC1_9BILA
MRYFLSIFVIVLLSFLKCSDAAVDAATKKIITVLQNQLTQPILVDYFKRGGSLDPAISTILQYVPSAEISSAACFLTNINGAISAATQNPNDPFYVVTYYRQTCNSDANLNKAMDVLADKTAQTRLRGVVVSIVNTMPAQIQSIALALIDRSMTGKNLTQAEAQSYVTKVKNLNTATKQAIFKKLPVLKKVLNKNGPLFKPYNVILTNLPILASNKLPTAAQRKNINTAMGKLQKFAHNNAVPFIQFALNWLKAQPIADSQNDPTVLQNYRTGAAKIVQTGKVALMLPTTQQTISQYFTTPYKLPENADAALAALKGEASKYVR